MSHLTAVPEDPLKAESSIQYAVVPVNSLLAEIAIDKTITEFEEQQQ